MLGESAGRSRRHPVGENARRRNTKREREGIDPPFELEAQREPFMWGHTFGHLVQVAYVLTFVVVGWAVVLTADSTFQVISGLVLLTMPGVLSTIERLRRG